MSANRLKLYIDKTELVWTGSMHTLSLLGVGGGVLSLQLGDDMVKPSNHVRLLGAADLGLDRHVSNVSKTCFFWLRQLRRVHRPLDIESVKTLVHTFVTSLVDYCNSVLSSAPKKVMNKFCSMFKMLQHV